MLESIGACFSRMNRCTAMSRMSSGTLRRRPLSDAAADRVRGEGRIGQFLKKADLRCPPCRPALSRLQIPLLGRGQFVIPQEFEYLSERSDMSFNVRNALLGYDSIADTAHCSCCSSHGVIGPNNRGDVRISIGGYWRSVVCRRSDHDRKPVFPRGGERKHLVRAAHS